MKNYIGLDIGGTKILGVLYDEKGNPISKSKKKTKASEGIEVVMEQIVKVIDDLIEDNTVELAGIGAGIPGLVTDGGIITFSPNIPLRDFNLRKVLNKKYDVPVVIGNDVNVAMFGEFKYLNRSDLKHVLGLFVGTGVGGAIIIDGKLYQGQGAAAEFGHMVVNSDGVFCGCGSQGCLEAYASKWAIQEFLRSQIKKGRKSTLKDILETDDVIKSSAIEKAYSEGDEITAEAIDRAIRYLGIALGSLINLFNPQMIILGGGMMESMGKTLLSKLIEESELHTMPGLMKTVEFKLSELGDDAGVYGAYQLIINNK
ncbi:MAG: ROK family protein [Clostridiales bacterium]|nr:ROK family protein [Clostridiales bacterium]